LEIVGGRSRGDWEMLQTALRSDNTGQLVLSALADQATELIAARWGSVSALAEVLMARGWLRYPRGAACAVEACSNGTGYQLNTGAATLDWLVQHCRDACSAGSNRPWGRFLEILEILTCLT
jgi:hypothetical protein